MALLDGGASQLTKEQIEEQQRLFNLHGCQKPIDRCMQMLVDSDSDLEPEPEPFFAISHAKIGLFSACCSCGKRRRRAQMNYGSWRFRLLVARYASAVLMSMVFLLASGQGASGQQQQKAAHAHTLALNESSRPTSNELPIHLSAPANATSVREQSHRSGKTAVELLSGSQEGVSMSRNSLISGDSLLQRQLREKAKQDSLESIKMHILLRLNLKKMPNMTKPEAVPQNILEQFYKNYNASLFSSNWGHNNKLNAVNTPRTGLEEVVTEEAMTQSSRNTHNLEQAATVNSSTEMQGDDPNSFKEFQLIHTIGLDDHQRSTDSTINDNDHDSDPNDDDNDDDEYMSILSHISSIFLFPEQPHMRHNRKTDVLRFKFNTGYSDISYVTLHLYLRGLDWISVHQPKIVEEIPDYQNRDIVVTLHRAIRRANSTSYTHKAKMFEFRHKIPSGQGQWVNVDLKPLFGAGATMGSPGTIRTVEVFVKGVEAWMRPLVVTTDNTSKNPLTVHIEVGSRKKHRRKRSVFMDCTESDHDMRCCRYPLKVNFTSFGWHFVVAPTSFDAYFCSGDCRVGYLEQYPHTHLAALTTSATPCCSPTKMSSLSLLYFDENHNLVLSVIPNMSVEGCSCSCNLFVCLFLCMYNRNG